MKKKTPVKFSKFCDKHQKLKNQIMGNIWVCPECFHEEVKSEMKKAFTKEPRKRKILRAQAVCGKELPSRLK